jgi:hypothetical protein
MLWMALRRWWLLPVARSPLSFWQRVLLLMLCFLQPLVRDWGRLKGILRYGWRGGKRVEDAAAGKLERKARPPRKCSINLGELVFWNDQGLGRMAWCQAVEQEIRTEGIKARRDDGWRRFDYELNPREEISSALASVTEYHGGDSSLTRVRMLVRMTYGVPLALLFVLVLEAWLLMSGRGMLQRVGMTAMPATLLVSLYIPWQVRKRLKSLAMTAARKVGLQLVRE